MQGLEEAALLPRGGPTFELFESKLHPPPARSGAVARTVLVDRLMAASEARVVSVVAPPGAGKTTLLGQWAERHKGVAWVSVDARDNDPAVFLTYAAAALDRVEPIDPRIFRTLDFPGLSIAADAIRASQLHWRRCNGRLRWCSISSSSSRIVTASTPLAQLTVGMPRGAQLVIAVPDRSTASDGRASKQR